MPSFSSPGGGGAQACVSRRARRMKLDVPRPEAVWPRKKTNCETNMAKLDEILNGILRDVDGALGVAVVDLGSGLLLSVSHSVPYFTQSYLEAVAAAAVDMVRGKNVLAVESLFSSMRGVKTQHSIKEIQMTTDNTLHFMAVIPDKPNNLVVLITNRKTSLGMGWAAVRNNIPKITPLCPS